MTDQKLFIHKMPNSRPADYYLGYMEGSVFIDFNNFKSELVRLIRISFDGYGCCDIEYQSKPLNAEDSQRFKDLIQDGIIDQKALLRIVKKAIAVNKEFLWEDALKEYKLL